MDLPMMVSPDSLGRLRDELAAAAAQAGRLAAAVEQVSSDAGWQGDAQRAFAAAARAVAGRLEELCRRLTVDAGRVEQLAGQLGAELAILHRLEHEVLGALRRLATRAVDDVSGEARSIYDSVRSRLPGSGSPGWRQLASTLVDGELR